MRPVFRALLSVVVASTILILAGAAMAAPRAKDVIDQQQLNDLGWYTCAGGGQIAAQTFTPGVSGDLTRLSLNLAKGMGYNQTTFDLVPPGDLIVEIRTTASATICIDNCINGTTTVMIPTEQVLATTVVSESVVAEYPAFWYDVPFADPALLIKGEVYAIVLRTNDPPASWDITPGTYNWHEYGDYTYDAYPGGHAMASNAVVTFEESIGPRYSDRDFVTYMRIVKNPR